MVTSRGPRLMMSLMSGSNRGRAREPSSFSSSRRFALQKATGGTVSRTSFRTSKRVFSVALVRLTLGFRWMEDSCSWMSWWHHDGVTQRRAWARASFFSVVIGRRMTASMSNVPIAWGLMWSGRDDRREAEKRRPVSTAQEGTPPSLRSVSVAMRRLPPSSDCGVLSPVQITQKCLFFGMPRIKHQYVVWRARPCQTLW